MKTYSLLFIVVLLAQFGASPLALGVKLELSREIFQGKGMALTHPLPSPGPAYLAMNLPFAPANKLREQLEDTLRVQSLANRGEAHITVLTPPEYKVLQSGPNPVTHAQIQALADKHRIQDAKFDIVCLGKAHIPGEAAYYVVVKSTDLLELRRAVFELYKKQGGNTSLFDPDNFYGHITLGFLKNDLHDSNGVKKGKNSCLFDIAVTD